MEYLAELAEHIIPVVGVILAGVLGVVGTALVRKLAALVGVKITHEQLRTVEALAVRGVAYAEEWALKKVKNEGKRPAGPDKLEAALEFVTPMARRAGLPELARDELVKLIESALGEKR